MAAGVVVDTSFLITLGSAGRENHATARRYWRHFAESGMPIFLSSIVVSEFHLKQKLPPEILRSCVILPFNWDDAVKAAEIDFTTLERDGATRNVIKDDVKIIAQAIVKDAAYVITDDKNSFHRYAERAKERGEACFKSISLAEGFDRSFFASDGQRDFVDALEDNSKEEEPDD